MSGTTPAAHVLLQLASSPTTPTLRPTLVTATPSPATPQGGGSILRNLAYNSPQPPGTTESMNLVNAINKLNRRMDAVGIIWEFEWQTKD